MRWLQEVSMRMKRKLEVLRFQITIKERLLILDANPLMGKVKTKA